MPRATAPQAPLEWEMWSVVDRAVDEVPPTVHGVDADAMRLCMTLRTASNVVFYDLREHLATHSAVTGQILNVLLVARLHGELEFHRLARFANMKKATASALVETLVSQGLLQRRTPAGDRRVTMLSLTDEGHREFERSFGAYNAREQYWASGLTSDETAVLATLLKKLVDARIGDSELHG